MAHQAAVRVQAVLVALIHLLHYAYMDACRVRCLRAAQQPACDQSALKQGSEASTEVEQSITLLLVLLA